MERNETVLFNAHDPVMSMKSVFVEPLVDALSPEHSNQDDNETKKQQEDVGKCNKDDINGDDNENHSKSEIHSTFFQFKAGDDNENHSKQKDDNETKNILTRMIMEMKRKKEIKIMVTVRFLSFLLFSFNYWSFSSGGNIVSVCQ